jgi:hypothetical protein
VSTLPGFSDYQGIAAVVSVPGAGQTYATIRYDGEQWAESAADAVLTYSWGDEIKLVDDTLLSAVIWVPDNFSSAPGGGSMQLMVGLNPLNDTEQGDAFLCYFGLPGDEAVPSLDLNINGPDSGTAVCDIDGAGGIEQSELIISGYTALHPEQPNTWTTDDCGGNWVISQKRPTGGVTPLAELESEDMPEIPAVALSYLCLAPDFAASGRALIGTQGDDCGVSLTHDDGEVWNTISLVAAMISDIKTLALPQEDTMYMSAVWDAPGRTTSMPCGGWRTACGSGFSPSRFWIKT